MKELIGGIFSLAIGLLLLGLAFGIVGMIFIWCEYLWDIHPSYIIILGLLLIMWLWYFEYREFIQFLGVILTLLIAFLIVVFQSEERQAQRVQEYLLNYVGYSDYELTQDISTKTNYQDYDINIKYSANKDLMNEFRNKVNVKEKKLVIVGDMMWQTEPFNNIHNATKVLWQDDANNYCNELTLEEFDDWRLPSISELGQYYRGDIKVDFDKSIIFWSSTESTSEDHDYQGMSFDGQGWNMGKNSRAYVLCVREL